MFPVSLWPLLSNDEQCKVLDIKFHAFQISFFFKIHFFKDMASCGSFDGDWKERRIGIQEMQRGEEEGTVPIWNVDKNRANRGKKCMPTLSLCVGHVIVIVLFVQRDVSVSSFCQQTRSL